MKTKNSKIGIKNKTKKRRQSLKIKILNSKNFSKEINKKPTIVMFHATWCGYCKQMYPKFRKMSLKNKNNTQYAKVDGTKNPNLLLKYNISGFPTFILFKNGKHKEIYL